MCITGLDGIFQTVNPMFEKYLGYAMEQVKNLNLFHLIHSNEIEIITNAISQYNSSGLVTLPILSRVLAKDGTYHCLSIDNLSTDESCLYISARDLTEVKSKEEPETDIFGSLHHQTELLENVLNAIPDFVCLMNVHLQFIFMNKAAIEMMGLGNVQYLGKTIDDLGLTYENLSSYKEEILEVFLTGIGINKFHTIFIHSKIYDLEYSIIPIRSEDQVRGVIYTSRDISEKIKDRKNFEASQKKLKKIIDLVPYPIFLKNNRSEYTLINSAQVDLFHTTYENLIGKSDEEFVNNHEELINILISDKKILEEQISVTLPEQIITDKDGDQKILHTIKIPFYDEIEDTLNILGVSIDITAIKKSEEELLRTNFELDSFVYKSSHDLRAPLRSLIGLINLAKKEKDPEMRNHILDRSNKSIIKLDNFILELTNFSRNSRVELAVSKIDFHAIIGECIENLKFMDNAQNVKVITDIQEQTPFLSDSSRISILFMNLISNAIKYQNLDRTDPFVKIKVLIQSTQAEIEISDNGIGIEEEFHKKIFDMFFRASENSFGSGLGLYIVKQVVDKLNGTITLSSEPNQGTIFSIVLPTLVNKKII